MLVLGREDDDGNMAADSLPPRDHTFENCDGDFSSEFLFDIESPKKYWSPRDVVGSAACGDCDSSYLLDCTCSIGFVAST